MTDARDAELTALRTQLSEAEGTIRDLRSKRLHEAMAAEQSAITATCRGCLPIVQDIYTGEPYPHDETCRVGDLEDKVERYEEVLASTLPADWAKRLAQAEAEASDYGDALVQLNARALAAEAQLSAYRDAVEAGKGLREAVTWLLTCLTDPMANAYDGASSRGQARIKAEKWDTALAALPPTPDDIARANEAYRTSCDCGGDPHLPGCPAALPPTERGENPGYGIVQDRLHEPSMALIDTCTCGDPWPCPERGEG